MGKPIWVLFAIASLVLASGYFNRIHCLSDDAPRVAVQSYITAMKDQRFDDAYNFVTATMTDGLPVEDWVVQQSDMFKMAKIVINKIDVRRGYRELNNIFMCAPVAKVSNVLHASDFLNNQGSSEHEIYTVIIDDGVWKIDSQETLFDDQLIHQWFPEDGTPTFKDTTSE